MLFCFVCALIGRWCLCNCINDDRDLAFPIFHVHSICFVLFSGADNHVEAVFTADYPSSCVCKLAGGRINEGKLTFKFEVFNINDSL